MMLHSLRSMEVPDGCNNCDPKANQPDHRRGPGGLSDWEFCLDEEGVEGMDETWVRPLAAAAVPNGAYSLSVAAEFETASGLRVNGLVGVTTTAGEVEISKAVLLFDGKYLFVPDKQDLRIDALREDDEKLRSAVADALGTSPVFPLRYRLSVLIEGEASHREGTVT
jgi:hypothetical protein